MIALGGHCTTTSTGRRQAPPDHELALMVDAVPDRSIVIAANNEAENIAPMCAALKRILVPLGEYEVIFVEDGSSDGTLDAIRAAAQDRAVRYLSLTRNFGHQTC